MPRSRRLSPRPDCLEQPRASGFINAILRRCQREQAQLLPRSIASSPCALRIRAGSWRVCARIGAIARHDILDANNQRPPFWIRVNRLRVTRCELSRAIAGEARSASRPACWRTPHCCSIKPWMSANYRDSKRDLVSVQDAAAQLAGHLLDPQPGERILDACAAPGGKTGHLLELAPELAALTAVDVSPERLSRVTQNLQRLVHGSDVAQAARGRCRGAGQLVGWQGIQPHSARCALFGDGRDPPPSRYQAAAAGG